MNQSEEKLKKPHFLPFLRDGGLEGIKNFPKNMEIANYLDWLYCQKLENSDAPIWRKVEKNTILLSF